MTQERQPRREGWTRNSLVKTVFLVSAAIDLFAGANAGASKISEAMSNNRPSENIPAAVGSPTPTPTESPRGTSSPAASPTAKAESITCPTGGVNAESPRLGAVVGAAIRVPSNVSSEIQAKLPNQAPQGEWFNPIYDQFQADAAHDWRGIGPWYPVSFKNLDGLDTTELVSHGNVGEILVRAKEGKSGRVAIGFYQEEKHQTDGAFGHDASGNIVKNDSWAMQYTFKGMESGQDILVADADNGQQVLWPDGSPMVFKANSRGEASFELPKACGDVRVEFVFSISSTSGVQPPEVKIERGPNDRPNLTGENKLPNTLIKSPVSGQ